LDTRFAAFTGRATGKHPVEQLSPLAAQQFSVRYPMSPFITSKSAL
jgi:hypothetical protein